MYISPGPPPSHPPLPHAPPPKEAEAEPKRARKKPKRSRSDPDGSRSRAESIPMEAEAEQKRSRRKAEGIPKRSRRRPHFKKCPHAPFGSKKCLHSRTDFFSLANSLELSKNEFWNLDSSNEFTRKKNSVWEWRHFLHPTKTLIAPEKKWKHMSRYY